METHMGDMIWYNLRGEPKEENWEEKNNATVSTQKAIYLYFIHKKQQTRQNYSLDFTAEKFKIMNASSRFILRTETFDGFSKETYKLKCISRKNLWQKGLKVSSSYKSKPFEV